MLPCVLALGEIRMTTSSLDELLTATGLSRETLESRVVSKKHRLKIAQEISTDWETLANFIGVSDQDVEDIKEEHRRPLNRRFALMKRWHQLYGSEATYLKLINGLIQVGRKDLIESLLSHLHTNVGEPMFALHVPLIGERVLQPKPLPGRKFKSTRTSSDPCLMFVIVILLVYIVNVYFAAQRSQPPSMWERFSEMVGITDLQSSNQESSSYMYNMCTQPGKPIQPSEDNNNFTRCSPPDSDLPIVDNEIFVGRENDISMVVSMMASAHIININGAPGIGKSALAIHVGYEMVRNGTSVRYIKMDEMASIFKKHTSSNERVRHVVVKNSAQNQETKSVIDLGTVSLQIFWSDNPDEITYAENLRFVQELKKWSSGISCPTLLILDNCDDILNGSSRDDFVNLIYSLLNHDQSQFNLHVIVVSMEKLFLLNSFKHWTVKNLSITKHPHRKL